MGSIHLTFNWEAQSKTLISMFISISTWIGDPHIDPGFVQVLENLERPGISLRYFPGLESPGKRLHVLESAGNLLNLSKKHEMYGKQ